MAELVKGATLTLMASKTTGVLAAATKQEALGANNPGIGAFCKLKADGTLPEGYSGELVALGFDVDRTTVTLPFRLEYAAWLEGASFRLNVSGTDWILGACRHFPGPAMQEVVGSAAAAHHVIGNGRDGMKLLPRVSLGLGGIRIGKDDTLLVEVESPILSVGITYNVHAVIVAAKSMGAA